MINRTSKSIITYTLDTNEIRAIILKYLESKGGAFNEVTTIAFKPKSANSLLALASMEKVVVSTTFEDEDNPIAPEER